MRGCERESANQRHADRWRRRRRIIIIAAFLSAAVLAVKWLLPTREEQLGAIDAKRAVRDEDNAAWIYAELLQGEEVPPTPSKLNAVLVPLMEATTDPVSLHEYGMSDRRLVALELPKGLLDPNDEDLTLWMPWTSAEYPELRQWLDTHRNRIDPQIGGSYVCQTTEEDFRLYSTGPNGKDENGEHTWNGPDDWPIWPQRGRPRISKLEDLNDV